MTVDNNDTQKENPREQAPTRRLLAMVPADELNTPEQVAALVAAVRAALPHDASSGAMATL